MPRGHRIDFPGAWHHVMNRGARRAPIFKRDDHCVGFLDAIGEASHKARLEVHAYSLMPNHFHLLVRSPDGTLSRAMKYLLGAYTRKINDLHGWDGPIFRGRFKSQLITRDDYLQHLVAYIHLNPVRAHLVASPDEPSWTSHRAHVGLEDGPPWLARSGIRDWFGSARELAKWVKAVQIGREESPEALDTTTGLYREDAAAAAFEPPPKAASRAGALLARATQVTGASLSSLRTAERGRSANPARRFAVLALLREGLGHDEVAHALDMSVGAVGLVSFRARHRSLGEEFGEWVKAWLDADDAPRPSPGRHDAPRSPPEPRRGHIPKSPAARPPQASAGDTTDSLVLGLLARRRRIALQDPLAPLALGQDALDQPLARQLERLDMPAVLGVEARLRRRELRQQRRVAHVGHELALVELDPAVQDRIVLRGEAG